MLVVFGSSFLLESQVGKNTVLYKIVDTGQVRCYNNGTEIPFPKIGAAFFGQDAHYKGNQPAYKDNGDGTVTDLNTGLMWQQDPGEKKTYKQAVAGASACNLGGYNDWRLSTIKELYSLILFSGTDPNIRYNDSSRLKPFIDTKYFKFRYGNPRDGDRIIDSQYATCTIYGSMTMDGNPTMFGVNFADGRIKGYPIGSTRGRREKTYYVMYVRGNTDYGKNDFVDNGDGTVTDKATGLMWMKVDSGKFKAGKMNWQEALKWAENLEYAGYSDWRLPNAKELQSIVDYSRCPDVTNSAAIDPVFEVTSIVNEGGKIDYPYYWTGTTHAKPYDAPAGVYIAFGRGLGFMRDYRTGMLKLMDVHGAGAQRCDIKSGNPSELPRGRGPQGDVMRIYNYVRCVRDGAAEMRTTGPKVEMRQTSRSRNRRSGQASPGEHFIRRLDRDGDGKVSREEFDGPAEHFTHFDKNRDGFISKEEAPKGPPPRGGRRHRRIGSGPS
jgi:hypothetical protein